MEYDKIKQLMEDMGNSKLTALDIDFPDGTKISMKKENTKIVERKVELVEQSQEEFSKSEKEVAVAREVPAAKENGRFIKSPMVGTFYLKPSPTSDPFVEIGKSINVGDTVCIIEAMKLMNEIEADIAGKIVEIVAKDGDPVEYGSPLFRVE